MSDIMKQLAAAANNVAWARYGGSGQVSLSQIDALLDAVRSVLAETAKAERSK